VRRILVSALGNQQRSLSIRSSSRFEAAAITPLAQACIIEIKSPCDVRENLDRISHFLRHSTTVAMSALDEQILALP
jgi:hypothetical protein